jgi:hypothetical protein
VPYKAFTSTRSASTAPPEFGGTGVFVRAGSLGTGEELEAALDARFAELEADFAAFEARATNGFGAFSVATGETASGGAETPRVTVSTAQSAADPASSSFVDEQPAAKERVQAVRAQKAGNAEDGERRATGKQKARKDAKHQRGKEREGKRNRHNGKHRDRR